MEKTFLPGSAPSLGMAYVDFSRSGGSFAHGRHGFGSTIPLAQGHGLGSPLPAAAPPTPAAPKIQNPVRPRSLSGGGLRLSQQDTAPGIDENLRVEIETLLASAITDLELDLDQVTVEMDSVTAQAIEAQPEGFRGIPIIGENFRADEVRQQVIRVAQRIEALSERIRTGVSKPYLTARQAEAVAELSGRARDLAGYARQFDIQPIQIANQQLSDEHLEFHVKGIRDLIEGVEATIVTAEGAIVPVQENKGPSTVGVVVGVSLIVLVGLIAFDVI